MGVGCPLADITRRLFNIGCIYYYSNPKDRASACTRLHKPDLNTTSPPDNESKEERGARVQLYASELLSLQTLHGPDNSSTQPRVLWSVGNRYVRKGNGSGIDASSACKWFA